MFPLLTVTSCAASDETAGANGTRKPESTTSHPAQASMQTRPCFSSASRMYFMLYWPPMLRGSKPWQKERTCYSERSQPKAQECRKAQAQACSVCCQVQTSRKSHMISDVGPIQVSRALEKWQGFRFGHHG